MATNFTITGSQPYTYLDKFNRVVDGYKVFFTYVPNGATYFVNVATLDQGTVKTAVDALVKQLDDLSKI
jgi:hypothetical protein